MSIAQSILDDFGRDLLYAGRLLRSAPGFTLIAALTLAVGIGGITTIFSVVNGVILRPLPYGDAARLVMISETRTPGTSGRPYAPPPAGTDWPDRVQGFSRLTTFEYAPFTFMDGSDSPLIIGGRVPPNYFSVLQAQPVIGRNFTEQDATGTRAAIVTHSFWQSRLGADPNAIGQTLKFAEGSMTLIGVMPPAFRAPFYTDALIFTAVPKGQTAARFFGRLTPGMNRSEAEAAVNALIKAVEADQPAGSATRVARIEPILPVDSSNRALLFLLLGSVGFLLLMAIINVANLMLSRTVTREREIVVRTALGGSRSRLVRQLLTESLLLSAIGGSLGLFVGYAGIRLVVAWIPETFPRVHEIYMDPAVTGFVLVTTLLTAIGFGIFPAIAFSRVDLHRGLKDSTNKASEHSRNRHLRQALVAAEIGLGAMLLIGAALTGKSFWNIINVPIGLDPQNVIVARIGVTPRYRTEPSRSLLQRELIERIGRHPEVEAASLAGVGPVYSGRPATGFWRDGSLQRVNAAILDTEVTSEYFRALGVPVLEGRTIQDGEQTVVINETFANTFLANSDPIGRQLRFGPEATPGQWLTVVGVVRDQRPSLTRLPMPQVFRTCVQCGILFVKSRADSAAIGKIIRAETASIDSSLIVTHVWSMEATVFEDRQVLDSRFRMALFAAFAGAGILLAFAGVYGVTSYSAAQRTREVGIRMALGASRWNVLRMMIEQSMIPIGIGIGGGIAASLALSGLLKSYLFEVAPTDAAVYAAVPVFLALVAIVANFIPACLSTRIDPMAALRHE